MCVIPLLNLSDRDSMPFTHLNGSKCSLKLLFKPCVPNFQPLKQITSKSELEPSHVIPYLNLSDRSQEPQIALHVLGAAVKSTKTNTLKFPKMHNSAPPPPRTHVATPPNLPKPA
jgi:hypothetical protein